MRFPNPYIPQLTAHGLANYLDVDREPPYRSRDFPDREEIIDRWEDSQREGLPPDLVERWLSGEFGPHGTPIPRAPRPGEALSKMTSDPLNLLWPAMLTAGTLALFNKSSLLKSLGIANVLGSFAGGIHHNRPYFGVQEEEGPDFNMAGMR